MTGSRYVLASSLRLIGIDTPETQKPGVAVECVRSGGRGQHAAVVAHRARGQRLRTQTQTQLHGGARRAFELHGLVERQRNEHDQHE